MFKHKWRIVKKTTEEGDIRFSVQWSEPMSFGWTTYRSYDTLKKARKAFNANRSAKIASEEVVEWD